MAFVDEILEWVNKAFGELLSWINNTYVIISLYLIIELDRINKIGGKASIPLLLVVHRHISVTRHLAFFIVVVVSIHSSFHFDDLPEPFTALALELLLALVVVAVPPVACELDAAALIRFSWASWNWSAKA